MEARPIVPVWIIQDTRSGNFLGRDLNMHSSMKEAGRCYDAEEAKTTAICQFGYEYEIHQFYEVEGD